MSILQDSGVYEQMDGMRREPSVRTGRVTCRRGGILWVVAIAACGGPPRQPAPPPSAASASWRCTQNAPVPPEGSWEREVDVRPSADSSPREVFDGARDALLTRLCAGRADCGLLAGHVQNFPPRIERGDGVVCAQAIVDQRHVARWRAMTGAMEDFDDRARDALAPLVGPGTRVAVGPTGECPADRGPRTRWLETVTAWAVGRTGGTVVRPPDTWVGDGVPAPADRVVELAITRRGATPLVDLQWRSLDRAGEASSSQRVTIREDALPAAGGRAPPPRVGAKRSTVLVTEPFDRVSKRHARRIIDAVKRALGESPLLPLARGDVPDRFARLFQACLDRDSDANCRCRLGGRAPVDAVVVLGSSKVRGRRAIWASVIDLASGQVDAPVRRACSKCGHQEQVSIVPALIAELDGSADEPTASPLWALRGEAVEIVSVGADAHSRSAAGRLEDALVGGGARVGAAGPRWTARVGVTCISLGGLGSENLWPGVECEISYRLSPARGAEIPVNATGHANDVNEALASRKAVGRAARAAIEALAEALAGRASR